VIITAFFTNGNWLALYNLTVSHYHISMFVAVAVDAGSNTRAKEIAEILVQYGFARAQRGLWESTAVTHDTLKRLKRDLDKATDADDRLKFFQFPIEENLVLSFLREKKWRRVVVRKDSFGLSRRY
jgi:CRISPR-associated protein Cas2